MEVIKPDSLSYHEAGHALMCIHLERPFKFVTIEPFTNETLGIHYNGRVYGIKGMDDTSQATNNILIALAGITTESICAGKFLPMKDYGSDYNVLCEMIVPIWGVENFGKKYMEYRDTTERILKSLWWRVEAVAKALEEHRTLNFEQVKAIITKA